jgi:hypothetical protein
MSRARGRWIALGVFLIAGLLAGCRSAEVVNHCLNAGGDCPPCASDADCAFTGNPCTEKVFCAHRESSIAVADIGCDEAIEYGWPDPEECACVASVCQYADD